MFVSSEARVIGSLNFGLCMSTLVVALLVLPAQCSTSCNAAPTPQGGDVSLLQAASQTNRVTMSKFFAEDILTSSKGLIIPSAVKLEGNMKVIMFVLCLTVGVIVVMCCVYKVMRSRSGVGEEDDDGQEASSSPADRLDAKTDQADESLSVTNAGTHTASTPTGVDQASESHLSWLYRQVTFSNLEEVASKQETVSDPVFEPAFCPELVVPENCECALLLPNTVVTEKTCDILDPKGNIVLQVIPKSQKPWQVALETSKGQHLAQCGVAPEGSAQNEYHFFQASGNFFAKLEVAEDPSKPKTGASGTITFVNGSRLQLNCLSEGLVDLHDETGDPERSLRASLEHMDFPGAPFQLRVAPSGDAGVALCGVLCISHWRKFVQNK